MFNKSEMWKLENRIKKLHQEVRREKIKDAVPIPIISVISFIIAMLLIISEI